MNTSLVNTLLVNITLAAQTGIATLLLHLTTLPTLALPPSFKTLPPQKLSQSLPPTPDSPTPTPNSPTPTPELPNPQPPLSLPPETLENSPVLQRWLEAVPDVRSQIRHDPAFRTRLRLGYAYFPREESSGFSVGVEDVFLGQTGLTLSGEYQRGGGSEGQNRVGGDRQSIAADLRYYVFPLGSRVNLAPVVGYRHLETEAYTTSGLNLGARLQLSLSRTGAADLSLTQSWVAPGSNDEVGITTLSLGYALTRNLRISTDVQKQNARQRRDSRVGILLEWML